ncbi:Y-family DNA polymerase [Methylophilus sp. TWE2]|uniref:Y-family DNA polymerase n=1 Tax=Methylophilus sp. TWE2 TaxID=1662285 RepID=UPI001E3FCB18|nr:Y-family DNA polymerase [Methylophilus sp. TWE2]
MSSIHSRKRVFALADVNSMYASCEEVFRPDIQGKPVVVLSNNDGCVIAQNKLAKETLDIYMARPWFEIKEMAEKLGTVVFSSNYELYANMSNRFAAVLSRYSPRMEKYSIDEVFLEMTGIKANYTDYGQEIKRDVRDSTGLPICVGFGHSKTLAKLANHCAKKQSHWNGVCDLTSMSEDEVDTILAELPVGKVWGVGNRLEAKLNEVGVFNVLRLKNADPKRIRDKFGVLLERTARELSGEVWIEMEDELPEAKQVMSSRSFGVRASTMEDLSQAIAFHAGIAAERMRSKGLYANGVYVFAQNSPHDQADFYPGQLAVGFPAPTNSTTKITKAALWLLKKIYRPGIYFQKCGVMLLDTVSSGGLQSDMFGFTEGDPKSEALMEVIDRIKQKYPNSPVKSASEGKVQAWKMQRNYLSPNYTGNWNDLLKVK